MHIVRIGPSRGVRHDHAVAMQRTRERDELVLVRHRNHTGMDSRALHRAAERGELVKVRSGAFVRAAVWRSLAIDQRIRLEVIAASEVHRGSFIASHRSAAALWGMPRIGRHDGLVHQRVTTACGSRVEHGMRKHAVADTDLHLDVVDGVTLTSLERTVLDIAATEPFAAAVTMADWALAGRTTKERLATALDEWGPVRGRHRIAGVVEFADGDSGSAGESVSRVQMWEAGLTMPVLQHRFDDARGLIGFVDFWWPDFHLIGEFDGLAKYRDQELLQGRTSGQVVTDEKIREDRLRAEGEGMTRWIWDTLDPVGQLERQLRRAGLR